jgi:hypothetical protein
MTRALPLLALLVACSPSQAEIHAEILRGVHGTLDVATTTVNAECPPLVEREGPPAHAACTRAGTSLNSAVTAWGLWASTTLQGLAEDRFDAALALSYARQILTLYADTRAALEERVALPELPRLLLTLARPLEPSDE